MKLSLYPLVLCLLLIHCNNLQKNPELSLHLLKEQSVETPQNSKVDLGGISGLNYDPHSKTLLALSDSKKQHRIYKFSLQDQPPYGVQFQETLFLHTVKTKELPFSLDPEGLVQGPDGNLYIASEGQQIFKTPDPPQILVFTPQGQWIETWPTPPVFWDWKNKDTFGTQENRGFESLSLSKDQQTLWTATEKPLKQDLKNQKTLWIRLSQFHIKSKKLLAQWAYPLHDPSKGLTEVFHLKNKTLLTLERSYDKNKQANHTLIFLTQCEHATLLNESLLKTTTPCSKKMLWSSTKETRFKITNLEGMTLVPIPKKQSQLLILVSDNNFRPKQKTQFLFFELKNIN